LILADEPTAALDKKSARRVLTLLHKMAAGYALRSPTATDVPPVSLFGRPASWLQHARAKGTTSLIVTHDSSIMDKADRVVEMDRGRIAKNIIVKERLFIYEGLRKSPAFAALLPEDQFKIADGISICLDPNQPIRDPNAPKIKERMRFFHDGDEICREGVSDPNYNFFLIRRGTVGVWQRENGREVQQAVLHAGEIFGDQAVVNRSPRNATVKAIGDLETYIIEGARFDPHREAIQAFIRRTVAVYGRPAG
jgi:energy-coupling factor transporter ATP-binding protein EcfA2